jgi:hypothetical protein
MNAIPRWYNNKTASAPVYPCIRNATAIEPQYVPSAIYISPPADSQPEALP